MGTQPADAAASSAPSPTAPSGLRAPCLPLPHPYLRGHRPVGRHQRRGHGHGAFGGGVADVEVRKVRPLRLPVQHHVLEADVAVHHPPGVEVRQGGEHLGIRGGEGAVGREVVEGGDGGGSGIQKFVYQKMARSDFHQNFICVNLVFSRPGGGGVGTRPRYWIVCLWRRLLASHHGSY